ncbi:MAG: SRPBCC family protein [Pseudomonadota bacterium]
MKTTEAGALLDAETVCFRRVFSATVDQLWEFLVDGERRARWLAGGVLEPRKGGRVELHFYNAGLSDQPDDLPPPKYADLPERVSFSGVVTRWEPKRILAHTWVGDDEDSEVTYELAPHPDGVELTLTHRRLRPREHLVGACGGWHTHLAILGDVLAGRPPAPFWRAHTAYEAEYEAIVP